MEREGFSYSFNPNACETCGGRCCTGESGMIWVSYPERESIAAFLSLDMLTFNDNYTFKEGYNFSLNEKPFEEGFACIFFDEEQRHCSIYPVRPNQCRTFPFWDYYKNHTKEAQNECPGILLLS